MRLGAQRKVSETYRIVQAMKATGNRPGIIEQWKAMVAQWAKDQGQNVDAAAVRAWLPLWQSRPFYTVQELAPIWPALAIATGVVQSWPRVQKSAKRLEHELDFHRLPRLPAPYRSYFICERLLYWRSAPLAEIESALAL